MQNARGSNRSQQRATGHNTRRQASAFEVACASVFSECSVATVVTKGLEHSLCYANLAFLELAGSKKNAGLGRPLPERFPELVHIESRELLDRVWQSSHAESTIDFASYWHPMRGQLYLSVTAWPCGRADALTVIQFVESSAPEALNKDARLEDLATDMRAVNERLLVAGVHQQELAAEANRRMAVAEQAAERSESALESSVAQTQSLARRLITAQEAERIRLAGELHDDVNQQLAALSIDLSTLRDNLPESRATLRAELDRLQQRTTGLIDTVRGLSHELHPGSLRVVGLLPALRRLCAETETHDGVVELRTTMDDLTSMPDDIALTLYRVAQEALRNVVRHAHAQHTSVTLTRDRDHIRLRIADDGRGFVRHDISSGLGLLSMEERVLGVNGDLSFESIVGLGTRIELTIPIPGPSQHTAAPRPVAG